MVQPQECRVGIGSLTLRSSLFLAFFSLLREGQSCAYLPREFANYMCSNCNRVSLQGKDPTPFLCLGLLGSLVMPIDTSEHYFKYTKSMQL